MPALVVGADTSSIIFCNRGGYRRKSGVFEAGRVCLIVTQPCSAAARNSVVVSFVGMISSSVADLCKAISTRAVSRISRTFLRPGFGNISQFYSTVSISEEQNAVSAAI
jgi:hypothetical protein